MPTLQDLIDGRVDANQAASDYVGVHKLLLDTLGLGVRGATWLPRQVLGDEPVYGTLGLLGRIVGTPGRAILGAGTALAEGASLEDLLKRTARAVMEQEPVSGARFMRALGVEDQTGITNFLAEAIADTAGLGVATKALGVAGQAAGKLPKIGPMIQRRELGKLGGQRLKFGALEAEQIERQLMEQTNLPLRQQARAKLGEATRFKEQAGEAWRAGREEYERLKAMPMAPGLPPSPDLVAARLQPHVEAIQQALRLRDEAISDARKLRSSQIARVLEFQTKPGAFSKDAAAALLDLEKGPRVTPGVFEVTRSLRIGEVPKAPRTFTFDGRANQVWKDLPADTDFPAKVALAFTSEAVPDSGVMSFLAGKFLSVRARMDKLGLTQPLLKAQRGMEKALVQDFRHFREIAKVAGIEKNSEASRLVRDWLDAADDTIRAGIERNLTPEQLAFGQAIRGKLEEIGTSAGLPRERFLENYFPHDARDFQTMAQGFAGRSYADDVPGFVVDRFFKKREGVSPPYELFEGFEAYARVGRRKQFFDPVLKEAEPFIEKLPMRLNRDATTVVNALLGKPHALDHDLSNALRRQFGMAEDPSRISRWSAHLVGNAYRGALWGNIGTMLLQISQGVNTAATLGFGRTLKAMMAIPGARLGKHPLSWQTIRESIGTAFEEFRRPVLRGKMGAHFDTLDDAMFSPVHFGDNFSRGAAVIAGYEEALSRGWGKDFALSAAKRVEQETQFIMGPLGRAPLANNAYLRPFFMFSQYPLQQIQFITNQLRKGEMGNFFRYVLAVGYTSKLADDAGIDLSNIETPMTLQQARNYLTLKSTPPVRMLFTLLGAVGVDWSDQKQVDDWKDRMLQSTSAFIPVLPRARMIPGAREQVDVNQINEQLGIPLTNPRGQVVRWLSGPQYLAQAAGVPTTRRKAERELIGQMLEQQRHFIDQKQDLTDQALRKLAMNYDITPELLLLTSLTGNSTKDTLKELWNAAGEASKTRIERTFENLPKTLKLEFLGRVAREPGRISGQMGTVLGAGM